MSEQEPRPSGPEQESSASGEQPYAQQPSTPLQPYAEPQYPQQPYAQEPYAQQPYAQQPYAQQPYAQQYPQQYAVQPYTQPYGAGYGYAYAPAPPTNQLAVISLVLGIVGLVVVPVIASIPAIITGHMARRQIRERGEGGDGMAVAGLVTGYLGAVGWTLLFLAIFLPLILVAASSTTAG